MKVQREIRRGFSRRKTSNKVKLADNVILSNALLYFLEKNKGMESIPGGQDIRQPVRYARFSSRGFYSGAQTLATAYNEKKTALVFDWKQYFVNITITGLDKLKNAGKLVALPEGEPLVA